MTTLKYLRDRIRQLEAELGRTTNTVAALLLQARLEELAGVRVVVEARQDKSHRGRA